MKNSAVDTLISRIETKASAPKPKLKLIRPERKSKFTLKLKGSSPATEPSKPPQPRRKLKLIFKRKTT